MPGSAASEMISRVRVAIGEGCCAVVVEMTSVAAATARKVARIFLFPVIHTPVVASVNGLRQGVSFGLGHLNAGQTAERGAMSGGIPGGGTFDAAIPPPNRNSRHWVFVLWLG